MCHSFTSIERFEHDCYFLLQCSVQGHVGIFFLSNMHIDRVSNIKSLMTLKCSVPHGLETKRSPR